MEKREEDAERFVKTSTFTKLEEKVEEELEIDHGASWQKGQKSLEQRKGHRHAIRMWKSNFFLCLWSPCKNFLAKVISWSLWQHHFCPCRQHSYTTRLARKNRLEK